MPANNNTNNNSNGLMYKAKPTAEELKSVVLKKIDPSTLRQNGPNNSEGDIRSNLLAAIRHGIKLKRVEESRQREVEQNSVSLHDVASILARRKAMELSDSESEDGGDSNAWDDESEC